MRRVSWVRVVMDDRQATAEVFGVGSRLPVMRRVPIGTALLLAARGVPAVIHDRRTTSVPGSSRVV
jgi:hypothetical protein